MLPAKNILADVIDFLKPPPTLSLSAWTIQNRFYSSLESSIPGKYNPNFAPFQLGIMDAITNPDYEKVVVMASTRIGKTAIVTNAIGYYADLDPCPILYVRERDEDVKNFSKSELVWLFENTPCLKGKLAENKGKESSNTLNLKQFSGGSIKLVGSNSPANFSGYKARFVICDEIDKYSVIAGFGNTVEMAEGRTTNYNHNKKIVYISSPSVAHNATSKTKTIHSIFLESTQGYFHIACPHCQELQHLEWENLRFGHCRETLDDVYYQCSFCNGRITEAQKKIAIREGQWIDTFPNKKIKGFHISQLYSPFSSFEKIAEEWIAIDKSKDIYSIQRFKNEVLGIPFEEDLGLYRDSSDALYNRRERYATEVPMGASLLTMAVDTQDSWLSWTITGWGLERECWVVKSGRIDGDPATPGPWEALSKIIYSKYRHESGALVGIEKILVDTKGHQTTHVNRFLRGRGPTVQGIYGAGGEGSKGKPIITRAKRDTTTGLRKWEIGTNNAKTDIFMMLSLTNPGPGFVHFPWECDEAYFKELYSERKINGQFKKIGQRRNEKLDEMGYNLAAYHICLKEYTMEQRRDMIKQVHIDMTTPEGLDEPLEENINKREEEEAEIQPTHIPEIMPVEAIGPILSAKDRYLQKIRGNMDNSRGNGNGYWDATIGL